MPRVMPTKLVVEFDDGTQSAVPFEALPSNLKSEILRQPFAGKPSPNPEKERFLLLEWDDGWKEVFEVDAACTDLNRYYVISKGLPPTCGVPPKKISPIPFDKRSCHEQAAHLAAKELIAKGEVLRAWQILLHNRVIGSC